MLSILCSELCRRIDIYFEKHGQKPKKIVLGELLCTVLEKELEELNGTPSSGKLAEFRGIPIEIREDCILKGDKDE